MQTAIIGAGGISKVHVDALMKLGVDIVGVFDVNQANAERVARSCGSRSIQSIEEILGKVDTIHLLTPPSKRVEYACKAMDAGIHVLCEKPISVSTADAQQMIDCAKKNKVQFMMAFNMRFRRGYQLLRNVLDRGEIGDCSGVFSLRHGGGPGLGGKDLSFSWRTDKQLACGISVESLSHDIDLIRAIAGDVKSVRANTHAAVRELPQFDNSSSVVLKMKNGALGSINASWASYIGRSARGILGSKGSAMLVGNDQWDFTHLRVRTESMTEERIEVVNDFFNGTNSYLEENRHFYDCIKTGTAPSTRGEDGLEALKVSRAILKSAQDGKMVEV